MTDTCDVPGCDGPRDYLVHDPTGFDTLERWICGFHLDFLMGHFDDRFPEDDG